MPPLLLLLGFLGCVFGFVLCFYLIDIRYNRNRLGREYLRKMSVIKGFGYAKATEKSDHQTFPNVTKSCF